MPPPFTMATGGSTLYYNITLACTHLLGGGGLEAILDRWLVPPAGGGVEAILYHNVRSDPRPGGGLESLLYHNVGLYKSLTYNALYSLLFLCFV